MVKIVAVSDLHGYYPEIPECDILLIAGDILGPSDPFIQSAICSGPLMIWLKKVPVKNIVMVAGNHDIIFEQYPSLLPKWPDNLYYLQDSGVELFGLKIYGSPWQIRFYDWAFNEDEENLVHIWAKIPNNTDVLVTHSPPYGYGDSDIKGRMLGSPSLTHRILDIQPKIACWGHIHDGYSNKPYMIKNTMGFNVSLCTNSYKPMNSPIIIDL
jgi:Icc-related predicted phosphoesterase